MRLFEYVREALDALMRNKTRTILTMIGMFIGVGAVDAVYALSTGAAAAITTSVSSGNQPSLVVYSDPTAADPSLARVTYRDSLELAGNADASISRVVPYYSAFIANNTQRRVLVHQSGAAKALVAFAFSWIADDDNLFFLAGRNFSQSEIDGAQNVVVVSPDLAYQIYRGNDAALGQYINLGGTRFRIVGVINKDKGNAQNYFGGTYYFVLPYSTFHNFQPGNADALLVWTPTAQDEAPATDEIKTYLAHAHGPRAVYKIDSTREQLKTFKRVIDVISISLTAIGAISLLVAGIGIMNIMLVTVTERTREIGIRKSIGARPGDIVLQFLIEATLMAVAGGFAGLLLAVMIILLAAGFLQDKFGSFVIPYATVVALAFVFSFVVGLTFGTYPALRASRLDPVEALRS